MNVSSSTSLGMKRRLTETAVPAGDVAGIVVPSTEELISKRKRTQVRAYIKYYNNIM